jgi:hypothetical protein
MVIFRIEPRHKALEIPDFDGPSLKDLFCLQDRGLVIRAFNDRRRTIHMAVFAQQKEAITRHRQTPSEIQPQLMVSAISVYVCRTLDIKGAAILRTLITDAFSPPPDAGASRHSTIRGAVDRITRVLARELGEEKPIQRDRFYRAGAVGASRISAAAGQLAEDDRAVVE